MAELDLFYRFEAAYHNAGFFPMCNNKVYLLNSAKTALENYPAVGNPVENFIGYTYSVLKTINSKSDLGEFVIVEGVQAIDNAYFEIYNKQHKARFPNQFLGIYVEWQNGPVDICTLVDINYTPATPVTSSQGSEMLKYEREMRNQIINYYDNGRGALPLGTEINGLNIQSVLARIPQQTYSKTANLIPIRLGGNSARPAAIHKFTALNTEQLAIVNTLLLLVNRVLKPVTDQLLVAFFESLVFPQGYDQNHILANGYREFTVLPTSPNSGKKGVFKIIWQVDTKKVQRFYSPEWTSTNIINDSYYGSQTSLAFPYNTAGFVFYLQDQKFFYDFDDCQFEESCVEPNESYLMPIKSGDVLQFNIEPETANCINVNSVEIGIFDKDEVFIGKVGEASVPSDADCGCNPYVFKIILNEEEQQSLIDSVNQGLAGTKFGYRVSGPNGPIYWLKDIDTWPNIDNSQELVQYLVPFTNGVTPYPEINEPPYSITAAFGAGGELIITYTTTLTCSDGEYFAEFGYMNDSGVWQDTFIVMPYFSGGAESVDGAQLQATINIPYLQNGCYRLGLYNGNILYSMSNLLYHDDSDCFSTILSFSGTKKSIVSGIEYYNNWVQIVRLGINGGGDKPKNEEAIYRQSDGVFQRPSLKQNYAVDLHTDFIDKPTQYALSVATRHPIFVWNDKNLFVEGEFEVATIQDFTTQSSFENLAQVKFSALIQGYQPKNSTCINC